MDRQKTEHKGKIDPSLSFGRYLRAVRIERGVTLEEVARETRIGIETLTLIEKEDLSRLPADVFVKGFLRAFAKAVGADANRVVGAYTVSLQARQKSVQSEADLDRIATRFWPRLLLSLATVFVVIAVSVWFMTGPEKSVEQRKPAPVASPSVEPPPEGEPVPATGAPVPEAGIQLPSGPVAKGPFEPVPSQMAAPERPAGKLRLKVKAVEETWMEIFIDDEKPKEFSLKPGDQLQLEATAAYRLLIGNAGGVRLELNGSPVFIQGKSGQVIKLNLP
jgi:cytoskeleton protein RodZ